MMSFVDGGYSVVDSAQASPEAISEALYSVGHWLISMERFEDGKHLFRSMLRTSPADERPWIALAICHERTSEIEKADRILRLSAQACPRSARVHLARARLFRTRDLREDSERSFELAFRAADAANDDELAMAIEAERGSE